MGRTIVLQEDMTIITQKEKEILVRNHDLWAIDRQKIAVLEEKIRELEGKTSQADEKEIWALNEMLKIEKERSSFYKEQLEVTMKTHKEVEDRLLKMVQETKPTWYEKLGQKVGWVGLAISIGILIGLAF